MVAGKFWDIVWGYRLQHDEARDGVIKAAMVLDEALAEFPYSIDDHQYSKKFVDAWLIKWFGKESEIVMALVNNQPMPSYITSKNSNKTDGGK